MKLTSTPSFRAVFFSLLFFSYQTQVIAKDFSYKSVTPRNTAELNKKTRKFAKQLSSIVKSKDLNALIKHISPDIRLDFGGSNGLVDFLKSWELLDKPEKSKLWHEMERMLKLGGVVKNELIFYPYLFSDWPEDFDAFEYEAVTGNKVNFRLKPTARSQVIRQIDYEVVRPIKDSDYGEWVKIETHDNKTGYVHKNYIRSAIDYRMIFKKNCDGWKMVTLIAGD